MKALRSRGWAKLSGDQKVARLEAWEARPDLGGAVAGELKGLRLSRAERELRRRFRAWRAAQAGRVAG